MCVNHPHHEGLRKCLRCARDFCADCLPQHGLLCERCEDEETRAIAIAESQRPTPRNLLRRTFTKRAATTASVFGLMLLAAVLAGVLQLRNAAEEGIDPNLIRRIQVATNERVDLGDEGFDLLEIINGGEVVEAGPDRDDEHVMDRLHDGLFAPEIPPWRSAGLDFPIEITFKTRFRTEFEKVVIWNHPDEPASSYIRAFEVWTSVEDQEEAPDALTLAGRFTIEAPDPLIRFEFDEPRSARWIQLRILDTFGDAGYASAAELGIFTPARSVPQPPLPKGRGPVVL